MWWGHGFHTKDWAGVLKNIWIETGGKYKFRPTAPACHWKTIVGMGYAGQNTSWAAWRSAISRKIRIYVMRSLLDLVTWLHLEANTQGAQLTRHGMAPPLHSKLLVWPLFCTNSSSKLAPQMLLPRCNIGIRTVRITVVTASLETDAFCLSPD